MKAFNKLVDLIAGNMALLTIVVAAFCLFKPEVVIPFAGIKFGNTSITNALLMVIMFGMGTTLRVDDFKLVLQRPVDVLAGIVGQFAVMPFLGFILAKIFNLDAPLAIGLVLLGCVPGGTASNVLTFLAKGDVPLSVTITMCTTLLAAIATPALTYLYAGQWVVVDFKTMALSIVQVVIVPIVLGVIVHSLVGDKVMAKAKRYIVCCSVIAIVTVVAICVSTNAANLLQASALVVAVCVFLQHILGCAIGYLEGKVLKMDTAKMHALSIEIGIQNSGLGVGLAGQFADPLTALPCAVATIVHQICGSIIAATFAKTVKDEEEVKEERTVVAVES